MAFFIEWKCFLFWTRKIQFISKIFLTSALFFQSLKEWYELIDTLEARFFRQPITPRLQQGLLIFGYQKEGRLYYSHTNTANLLIYPKAQ